MNFNVNFNFEVDTHTRVAKINYFETDLADFSKGQLVNFVSPEFDTLYEMSLNYNVVEMHSLVIFFSCIISKQFIIIQRASTSRDNTPYLHNFETTSRARWEFEIKFSKSLMVFSFSVRVRTAHFHFIIIYQTT